MERMNYEQFKEEIKDRIKDFLPEEYKDCKITINEMYKNQAQLDGLVIESPTLNIAPTIYLNDIYGLYEQGTDIENILQQMAEYRVHQELDMSFDVSKFTEFDQVKDHIVPILVGKEGNEELLKNLAHKDLEDMAIAYELILNTDVGRSASIKIKNEHLLYWNTPIDELHDIAVANMKEITPATITNIGDEVKEQLVPQIMDEYGIDRAEAEKFFDEQMEGVEHPMYVVTNKSRINGAAVICDDDVMKQVEELVGKDFYILPSSIHETLVLSSEGMDVESLKAMVQEVNATQVDACDKLTDQVYQFDSETREIFRADMADIRNWQKQVAKDVAKILIDKESRPKEIKERPSLKDRLEDKRKATKAQSRTAPDKAVKKDQQMAI